MRRTEEFDDWCDGASDEELDELEARARKSFWKWFLISLIPFVSFITVGCAIFCYNNLSYIKSIGRNQGSNIVRGILILWGAIILPLIVVNILAKADKLGNKVLGWNDIDDDDDEDDDEDDDDEE